MVRFKQELSLAPACLVLSCCDSSSSSACEEKKKYQNIIFDYIMQVLVLEKISDPNSDSI